MLIVTEAAAPVAVAILPMFIVEVPIYIVFGRNCCYLKQLSKKKLNEDLRVKSKYLCQD